jgi:AraC-like DNA-binding protein
MSTLGRCLSANYPSDFLLFDAKPEFVNGMLQAFFRSRSDVQEIENLIIKEFNLQPQIMKVDSRISQLLEQIEASNFEGEKINTLCAGIYLSESRIRHLFKEQTGISIKRYCLWGKMRKALYYISQGESLIQAAYHANFSDYAHLSRTVKGMFGLNLKTLLKDSHSVQ